MKYKQIKSEKLNRVVFYSLRFCAVFYLSIVLMIVLLEHRSYLLVFFSLLLIGGLMYLFYRASEEARKGTQLGRVLTSICAALFFISFLMGNGEGMKWLGLMLSGYWSYKVVYWEYA